MKTPTLEITIDGPPRSGKSQLLNHLSELLKKNPFWMKGQETPELVLRTHPLGETPVVIEPWAPETVPLGENVTRSGLRARVLSNDSPGDYPVVAEVPVSPGSRHTIFRRYKADGKARAGSKLDLVGHQYHEIKAPEDTELEDLRRWKAEAMQVLAELNAQEIGKEMGLTIGQPVAPLILPYIRDLKNKLEAARKALA